MVDNIPPNKLNAPIIRGAILLHSLGTVSWAKLAVPVIVLIMMIGSENRRLILLNL
jgi:hypothetical protein